MRKSYEIKEKGWFSGLINLFPKKKDLIELCNRLVYTPTLNSVF